MKKTAVVLVTAMGLALTQANAQALTTEAQKVGYAIGADLGLSLEQLTQASGKDSIDVKSVIRGLEDAYAKKDLALTNDEMKKTMVAYAEKSMQALKDQMDAEAAENEKKGASFLAENAKKEGVKTTKSGLQYKVIKEGNGAQPKANDTVSVTYKGTLIDGTVFDSTELHGNEPITFNVQQVIPGWVEGLQLMKEGAEYQFYIPADLAYGKQGAGPAVPPNSTLIFDVSLKSVTPAAKVEDKKAK